MRYEQVLKRIQLSLPSKTACCMTVLGTRHADTARENVGSFSWKYWTVSRVLVAIRKEADPPKPPQERGLLGWAARMATMRRLQNAYGPTRHVR